MIKNNKDSCLWCGCCVGICPENAIFLNETVIEIDNEKCTNCLICVRGCPVGAMDSSL